MATLAAPQNFNSASDDAKVRETVLNRLSSLVGEGVYHPDSGVAFHSDPPNKISLPNGMSAAKGAAILAEVAKSQEEPKMFTRTFRVRPWDGAYAMQAVMQAMFGTTGRGVSIQQMFGSIPPRMIDIEIDWGKNAQIPWGRIEFEIFEGYLQTGGTEDSIYGALFELSVWAPKKYELPIQGFFAGIDMFLREGSIYKGKSFVGVDEPRYLDPAINPTIVYTDDVVDALETTVWGVLRNRALLKGDNRKVNKRILIEGPYGTGKSEAGRITAELCRSLGVTFIQFEGTKLEDLEKAARTAQLYSGDTGAVLWIEDVDKLVAVDAVADQASNAHNQSRLLELFDGISSKNDGVMIVMTTNHTADMSKGMLRAGRVDRIIQIAFLDEKSTKRMIELVIGKERLADDIDWAEVWKAMEGFEPAFVRTTFDQAAEAATIRNANALRAKNFSEEEIARQAVKFKLGTEDFITAAALLRPQHELHTTKSEVRETTLDHVFQAAVQAAIQDRVAVSWAGDLMPLVANE